jgi:hypothetical protein
MLKHRPTHKGEHTMAKQKKYEVTFAQGTENETTYPVEAENKRAAKEEFCQLYIGRSDQTLASLLKVVEVESDNEE